MINEKMITDKKMIEHMKPIIARHYEDMFLKNASTGGSFAVTVHRLMFIWLLLDFGVG